MGNILKNKKTTVFCITAAILLAVVFCGLFLQKQIKPTYGQENDYDCDIAWYRGAGIAGDGWRSNIQSVFEDLEANDGVCWEIIWDDQDIRDGVLQNPDGSPKYNLVYFMGGVGRDYNNGLGEDGAEMIRDFVRNGGNYVGTCAGAFYASDNYTGMFPGEMNYYSGILFVDYDLTSHEINDGFGSQLDDVQYYQGGWLEENVPNVDYAATYSTSDTALDGYPAVTINNYGNGLVVISGAHPEAGTGSNNINYFKRLITYALDNNQTTCLLPMFPNLICDDAVDIQDFNLFQSYWTSQNPSADFNNDSIINTQDFAIMLSTWGNY